MIVFADDAEEILDMYCRGMVVGLTSTKAIVKISTFIFKLDKLLKEQIANESKEEKKKQASLKEFIIKVSEKLVDGKFKHYNENGHLWIIFMSLKNTKQ